MKKTKISKNHVLFIFAFLLFLISGVYSIDCRQIMTAYAFSDHIILSEMSEEQCIDFIEENNIEIPNELISSPELGELIKITIETIEFDPTYNFSYDNDETQQFFNNIKELVNGYYGINEIEDYPSDTGYMLQYNWVLNDSGEWVTIGGAWDDSWEYYNCYAYAIGMTENIPITDDFPRGFDPGYFAYGQSCFNNSMSITKCNFK